MVEPRYLMTREATGERLSTIISEYPDTDVAKCLSKQASTLSEFHSLQINCDPVKDRRFFHIPPQEFCDKNGLEHVQTFLASNVPAEQEKCFVHGDFHYANILWEKSEISCVLDYELSGLGIREFDMAWSVFLRPGQKFLTTIDEVEAFLSGYANPYERSAFYYYYVQIAAHFLPLGDEEYKENVKRLINEATLKHK